MRKCSKHGCPEKHEAKGFCRHHYKQWRWAEGKEHRASYDYLKKWNRSLSGRYSQLKRAAINLNLGFDISTKLHAVLLLQPCDYCKGSLSPTGHGLDRKDSSKGYLVDNVVPCCVVCNRIKNRYLTHEEMKAAMRAVLRVRHGH